MTRDIGALIIIRELLFRRSHTRFLGSFPHRRAFTRNVNYRDIKRSRTSLDACAYTETAKNHVPPTRVRDRSAKNRALGYFHGHYDASLRCEVAIRGKILILSRESGVAQRVVNLRAPRRRDPSCKHTADVLSESCRRRCRCARKSTPSRDDPARG